MWNAVGFSSWMPLFDVLQFALFFKCNGLLHTIFYITLYYYITLLYDILYFFFSWWFLLPVCILCNIAEGVFFELAWFVGGIETVPEQNLQPKVSMCIRKHPWPKLLPVLQRAQGWRHRFFVLQVKFWPSRGKGAVALLRNTWSKVTIQMRMCSGFFYKFIYT